MGKQKGLSPSSTFPQSYLVVNCHLKIVIYFSATIPCLGQDDGTGMLRGSDRVGTDSSEEGLKYG